MDLSLIDLLKKCLGIIHRNISCLNHQITSPQTGSLSRTVRQNGLNKSTRTFRQLNERIGILIVLPSDSRRQRN